MQGKAYQKSSAVIYQAFIAYMLMKGHQESILIIFPSKKNVIFTIILAMSAHFFLPSEPWHYYNFIFSCGSTHEFWANVKDSSAGI